MKKILITLAIILSVQIADAQIKTAEAALKAVESAEKNAANSKKATKVATWMKLAEAYMDAYISPMGNAYVGAAEADLTLLMSKEKPLSEEMVTLNNVEYKKVVYNNKNLYYAANGVLAVIEVTKPVVENALVKASEAYEQAYAIDIKKSKIKDITTGFQTINSKYLELAMNAYTLGNFKESSEDFQLAEAAARKEPLNKIDSIATYNAGFTAWLSQDYSTAMTYFQKSIEIEYFEEGDVYAKLADCYTKLGEPEEMKNVLEAGFVLFPANQNILIGLINYYLESGGNTERLFELLNVAKTNEPTNASLYYVEGNIRKELGMKEDAVAAYNEANKVNPAYEFGFIGIGILYYESALEFQTKAQEELDDKKYYELVELFEKDLLAAYEPFEKAYSLTKDENISLTVAEYLKNICYRFRDKDPKYEEGFNKYTKILEAAK